MNTCPQKNYDKDTSAYHDFIKMPDERKQPARAKVVCAFCGQVRQVWVSGAVEVLRTVGEVTAANTGYQNHAP